MKFNRHATATAGLSKLKMGAKGTVSALAEKAEAQVGKMLHSAGRLIVESRRFGSTVSTSFRAKMWAS